MSVGRIMDEHGLEVVNLLKMDCEGSEFEILADIDPRHWARIDRLAMEYHLGGNRRRNELVAVLERNGFEVDLGAPWFDRAFGRVARIGALWARKRALL
jgi:hypothetical protein